MARKSGSGVRDIRANALDKDSESKKMSKVYSTAKINQILEDIKKGKKPDLDPFFHGKKEYRDCGITFERTPEEEEEYKKCAMDCIYFVEKYVKFKNDKGFTLVTLRDYQKDVLHLMSDEVWSEELEDVTFATNRLILLQSRQTSKCCVSDTQIIIDKNEENYINNTLKIKYNLFKYCINFVKNMINNVYQMIYAYVRC